MIMEMKKVKIGVISDTHLEHYDEKMKESLENYFSETDFILHAGDIVDLKVLDMFGNKEVKAVCGNMDNYAVRKKLPEYLLFEINGFKLLLIHGWGSPWGLEEKISARFPDAECVVYGHTHKPANHMKNKVFFFNPGSAADRFFNSSKTIGILEIDTEIKGKIIKI